MSTTEALPELPPLPKPEGTVEIDCGPAPGGGREVTYADGYSADQMRDYACAALAATSAPAAPEGLLTALRFYARGEHFHISNSPDDPGFESVSGEPENWLCSNRDDDETMIEDGTIALKALRGAELNWRDGDDDHTPQPVEGEAFAVASALATSAPSQPAGWKLVPVEITPEMVGAAAIIESSGSINGVPTIGMSGAVDAYAAMLDAAPAAPQPAPAVPQPEALAEPSDDPERDEFYRVFDESTKLTGHKPTPFDIWLMARGRMDTSHRTLVTIDLKHIAYDQMQQAASESKWIPPEYYSNDWIADCCRWLREGPPVAEVEERRELSDEIALAKAEVAAWPKHIRDAAHATGVLKKPGADDGGAA